VVLIMVGFRIWRGWVGLTAGVLLLSAQGCGASPQNDDKSGDKSGNFRMAEPDAGADPSDDGDGEGACDLSGVWAVRQTTLSHGIVDTVSANWYYIELSQDGDQLEAIDSIDCGYAANAAGASAFSSHAGDQPFFEHNPQAGRKGTIKAAGTKCDFHLGRFWTVRGTDEAKHLPGGPFATHTLAELQASVPMPNKEHPDDGEDWDQDGHPGVTLLIGSSDERYSANRDWSEYFSCNGDEADSPICQKEDVSKYTLTPAKLKDQFTVRADFESEDSVLGATNPLYEGGSMPLRIGDNRVTFKRLGSHRSDGKARELWSKGTATGRCDFIRELLPAETD
jgi:hypothetical protein